MTKLNKKIKATKEIKNSAVKLNKTDTQKIKAMTTKSAQIRYMDSLGFSRSDIAKHLTEVHGKYVRYQHVRNVLITPLKRPN